jgi:polysaccharide export outer membrane protein
MKDLKGMGWALLAALVLLTGCVGGRRNINYLQDGSLSPGAAKLFENRKFEYRIQVNDVLSIRVLGLDEATHRFFNVESQNGFQGVNDAALYVNGFSVDKNGQVQLPTVGRIKVQGLTMGEAQDLVQRKINEYFTNATVILKLVSFRISVLGDVRNPGMYFIYNNQITILDALAMAGGPNEYGDKSKVTLMRQSDRGVQALYVDLSGTEVLASEYYYLLPNDVVYVPTLKARAGRMNLELLSVLFGAISALALVANVVILNQNNN